MAIAGTGGEISYWGTPSGGEIDFSRRRSKRALGIEAKAPSRSRGEDAALLREFLNRKRIAAAYLVYDGRDVSKDRGVMVLPVAPPACLAAHSRTIILWDDART